MSKNNSNNISEEFYHEPRGKEKVWDLGEPGIIPDKVKCISESGVNPGTEKSLEWMNPEQLYLHILSEELSKNDKYDTKLDEKRKQLIKRINTKVSDISNMLHVYKSDMKGYPIIPKVISIDIGTWTIDFITVDGSYRLENMDENSSIVDMNFMVKKLWHFRDLKKIIDKDRLKVKQHQYYENIEKIDNMNHILNSMEVIDE